jgi:nucleoid-associated protein EbfC
MRRGLAAGRPGIAEVGMNGNIQKMMKQAQKLQRQMMEAQEALADERVEATSGGGMVKVVADGQQNVMEIKIDPEAVDPEDVEMLEDMILAAVSEALKKSRDLAEERLGAFTKGMKIPGL